METHPAMDKLLRAAAGDPDVRRGLAPHLGACSSCREKLSSLMGVLEAVGEELLEFRPGCLLPEELAMVPPGGEMDDPHLRDCPMCMEELSIIRGLEAERSLEAACSMGLLSRPELTTSATGYWLQAASGRGLELELREGAEAEFSRPGVRVQLRVQGKKLEIDVKGSLDPPVQLVLENELLERRIDLAEGCLELEVSGWLRARVRARKGER